MGALLYRWSTSAQLASVIMIALFYATLARSLKRAELVWWARSWWSNALAMAVTVTYWVFVPTSSVNPVLRGAYVGGKVVFAVLLVQGARAMCRPGSDWLGKRTIIAIASAAVVLGAFALPTINDLGVVVQGTLALLFLWSASTLLTSRGSAISWLAAGFVVRGGLAAIEALAYGAYMVPAGQLPPRAIHIIQAFLGAHTLIDLGGEWLLALGGVLAITQRAQHEIETANTDLLNVQAQLRNLADRDPLTGLANRRALPEMFRTVFQTGAVFVFFDLDSFKAINDTYGHAVGDQCLERFAAAMKSSFRPGDCIVRYAGDEFVVVAPAMKVGMVDERIARMRERLELPDESGVVVAFSAGIALMDPGGDAETALHQADEAMYAAKALKR